MYIKTKRDFFRQKYLLIPDISPMKASSVEKFKRNNTSALCIHVYLIKYLNIQTTKDN